MTAAKERTHALSERRRVALSLAAAVPVAENSRLGFTSKKTNSHRGWSELNFKTVTGIGASLRRKGIRSRCQSLNRYAYVLNNPTTLNDPMGLGDCSGNPNFPCQTNGVPPDPVSHGGGGGGGGVPGGGGATCEVDGAPTPCEAAAIQQQAGVAVQCPNNYCPPGITFQNSAYNNEHPENPEFYVNGANANLTLNCSGANLSSYGCAWAPWSLHLIGTATQGFLGPNDSYYVGNAWGLAALSQAGKNTSTLTTAKFWVGWTAAAAGASELVMGFPAATAVWNVATAPLIPLYVAYPTAAPIAVGIVQGFVVGGNPTSWQVAVGKGGKFIYNLINK